MWNTIKYTVLSLIREKNVLIWAFAFPIVLATIFNFMFANLDEGMSFDPVDVAVVKDITYVDSPAFSQMIDVVSEPGENQLLNVTYVSSSGEALDLLEEKSVDGYLTINTEGEPVYHAGPLGTGMSSDEVNRTIIKNLLDTYLQNKALLQDAFETDPSKLAQLGDVSDLVKSEDFTTEVSVTNSEPSQTVRYFYVLLGFSAMMAATIGLTAISLTLANTSALGARRSVGGTSRMKTLTATLLASWLLSFCCLVVGYLFIRYVFGIDFGGKDAACYLALAVASLVSTALGTFIGSFPISVGAKAGILTGSTCFLALFAGLYGEASMQLADQVSRAIPFVQLFNPAKQLADVFYSLYYYDGFTHYFEALGILLITAIVLFFAAAVTMRRQRYASI